MRKISIPDKIYTKLSNKPGLGRGVFARVNIQKGEVIETCPIIEVININALETCSLVTYAFFYDEDKAAIALGFGSLYNHSNNSNATYKISKRNKTIEFKAIKEIAEGDEIFFNYKRISSNKPLWFEDKNTT